MIIDLIKNYGIPGKMTFNMKYSILTIVGTRPEIIKLSRVIEKLNRYTNHTLVHTGQNYDRELNEIFFDDLGINRPDYYLNVAGESAVDTIGNVIKKSDEVIAEINPDAIVIYGDTNSCLSVISAKRRRIPVFHLEAGNRCFDQRVPEEINRKIVDHLSDINITLTEHARRYLIEEGIRQQQIVNLGSPMDEIFHFYIDRIESSDILTKLSLKRKNYFIISSHREENIDSEKNFNNLLNTLSSLDEYYDKDIIFSTHPRTQKKLLSLSEGRVNKNIRFLKPLGFFDYVNLMKNSYCVLSDSGTITEEASLLNFPAVNIREVHERPEGTDKGILIMSGLSSTRVVNAINVEIFKNDYNLEMVSDYNSPNFSDKVINVIHSNIDYINRTVWFKN